MLNRSVLLLNQNFIPISVCTVRRAVVMVWTGKAEIVESAGHSLNSVSARVDVPAIIRLMVLVRVNGFGDVPLTKQNIIRRDHGICQYCGSAEGPMTVDHVIPRSLGGRDDWGNLVCACPSCNNLKGNRTPHQAGMRLIRKPRKPSARTFRFTQKSPLNRLWQPYILG
jgi:5-methylcytosine-specific restriction endonuclease McrA